MNIDIVNAVDCMDNEPGTANALRSAETIVAQSAGMALVCALALESVSCNGYDQLCSLEDVTNVASKLLFKCFDDLTVATGLIS